MSSSIHRLLQQTCPAFPLSLLFALSTTNISVNISVSIAVNIIVNITVPDHSATDLFYLALFLHLSSLPSMSPSMLPSPIALERTRFTCTLLSHPNPALLLSRYSHPVCPRHCYALPKRETLRQKTSSALLSIQNSFTKSPVLSAPNQVIAIINVHVPILLLHLSS